MASPEHLSRIEALVEGRAPFYEPGLDDLLMRGLSSGRLRFTRDLAEAERLCNHIAILNDGRKVPISRAGYQRLQELL